MSLINSKILLTKHYILLQVVMIILTLFGIILFSLLKTQNHMSLWSLYQQNTIENYQNFLSKELKDQLIGMNIKKNARIKMQ